MAASAPCSEECRSGSCLATCQCKSPSPEGMPPSYDSLYNLRYQITEKSGGCKVARDSQVINNNTSSKPPKPEPRRGLFSLSPRELAFLKRMSLVFDTLRRDKRKNLLANTPPGFAGEKLRMKLLLGSLKHHTMGEYTLESDIYPDGFPLKEDAAQESIICKEHGDNQCYCIGFKCLPETVTVFMDWKPFALGKYERMKRGAKCEIHGGYGCFCWLEPFGNEKGILKCYDLKNNRRIRVFGA